MDFYSEQQIYGRRHLSSRPVYVRARQYGHWLFLDEFLPERRVKNLTLDSLKRSVLSGMESDRFTARPTDPAPIVEWFEAYLALGFYRTLHNTRQLVGSMVGGLLAGFLAYCSLINALSLPGVHALAVSFCAAWTIFELSQNTVECCRDHTVKLIRSYLRTSDDITREDLLDEARDETTRRLKQLKHRLSMNQETTNP